MNPLDILHLIESWLYDFLLGEKGFEHILLIGLSVIIIFIIIVLYPKKKVKKQVKNPVKTPERYRRLGLPSKMYDIDMKTLEKLRRW